MHAGSRPLALLAGVIAGFLLASAGHATEIEEEVARCRKSCLRACGTAQRTCLRPPPSGIQAPAPASLCSHERAACQKRCVEIDCAT